MATARPYQYYEYRTPLFGTELQRLAADCPPDLVHLDSLDLFGWLSQVPDAPVAVTHHSIESDLLRRRAAPLGAHPMAAYLRYQAQLVAGIERRYTPAVDLNVMMSEVDAARLRELAPDARTVVVPNGVDVTYFAPAQETTQVPGRIVFLGPTYMFPNYDAVDWFLQDSWPLVRRRRPDASFHLIGRALPADAERFGAADGVRVLGYLDDIRPAMLEAECCVVPLRVGGGTRLKILDAWALGKAVVSTSIGCEGLEARDGENILIRDEPGELAEAVVEVLADPVLRARLGAAARDTAESVYSWERIGVTLREAYRRLMRGPAADRLEAVARPA